MIVIRNFKDERKFKAYILDLHLLHAIAMTECKICNGRCLDVDMCVRCGEQGRKHLISNDYCIYLYIAKDQ